MKYLKSACLLKYLMPHSLFTLQEAAGDSQPSINYIISAHPHQNKIAIKSEYKQASTKTTLCETGVQ